MIDSDSDLIVNVNKKQTVWCIHILLMHGSSIRIPCDDDDDDDDEDNDNDDIGGGAHSGTGDF
jgi:hypothetical protein